MKGGIIGVDNHPTVNVASGMWKLVDINKYREAKIWPGSANVAQVYQSFQQDTVDRNAYTHSSVSIGTASADRYVLVAAGGEALSGNAQVVSMTIGGVTGSNISTTYSTTSGVSLFGALVPTGTTATIVVTYVSGTTMRRNMCAVWTITGYASSTPVDTDATSSASATGLSCSLNIKAGDAIIAVAEHNTGTGAYTWTGVTENFDEGLEGTNASGSGGSIKTSADNAAYSVSFTSTNSADKTCLVAASWR